MLLLCYFCSVCPVYVKTDLSYLLIFKKNSVQKYTLFSIIANDMPTFLHC
ncbi:Uncharacterised protein [Segatella copri]|nr:Uncharacterised protein [Segatella copri]